MKKVECPKYGKICLQYGQKNHYSVNCKFLVKFHSSKGKKSMQYTKNVTIRNKTIHMSELASSMLECLLNTLNRQMLLIQALITETSNVSWKFQKVPSTKTLSSWQCKHLHYPLKYAASIQSSSKRPKSYNNDEITFVGTTKTVIHNPKNIRQYSVDFMVGKDDTLTAIS